MENKSPIDSLLNQASEIQENLTSILAREKRELKESAFLGFFLSLAAFFIFGLVLYFFFVLLITQVGPDNKFKLSLGVFFLFYPVVFTGFIFLAQAFEPKEEYYLGETWGGRLMDNPFTFRDNVDRQHFALGFLLVIPNFVYLNFKNIMGFVTNRHGSYSPTLAAAMLIMAREKIGGNDMMQILQPKGFRRGMSTGTLKFLDAVGLVQMDLEESPPVVSLTVKGEEALLECGWAYAPVQLPSSAAPSKIPEI